MLSATSRPCERQHARWQVTSLAMLDLPVLPLFEVRLVESRGHVEWFSGCLSVLAESLLEPDGVLVADVDGLGGVPLSGTDLLVEASGMVVVDASKLPQPDYQHLDRDTPYLLQLSECAQRDSSPHVVEVGKECIGWSQERASESVGLLFDRASICSGGRRRCDCMQSEVSDLMRNGESLPVTRWVDPVLTQHGTAHSNYWSGVDP